MPNDQIETAVNAFLTRFSPPRSIASSPELMAEEVMQITAAVARFAPRTGFSDWWPAVGTAIVQRMKTRSWPIVSEVETACRIVNDAGRTSGSDDATESAMIDAMEKWFTKFGSQMPSCGRPSRTMALIRRGVLLDLRHARFCGFDLTPDQMESARDMPMSRAEEKHDRRVHDDLAAVARRMARYRDEFAALRETVKPQDSAA